MTAPLIVQGSTFPSATSLEKIRRALCDELGELGIATVTTVASSVDRKRQILCDGFRTDGELSDRFDGYWIYVCDGDQAGSVRRVLEGTYDGPWASVLLDDPLTDPLEAGTTFEITNTLPARRHRTVIGLRDVINQALEELPVIDRVSITTVANQERYDFINYPWPVKKIVQVYEPRDTDDDPLVPVRLRWSYEHDAELPQLVLEAGYEAGKTLTVELHRPAKTWISSGGAWGDSTVGLQNDADETVYDVRTVVLKALPIAHRRMANLLPKGSPERAEELTLADVSETKAAWARFYGTFRGSGAQRAGARWGY